MSIIENDIICTRQIDLNDEKNERHFFRSRTTRVLKNKKHRVE